MNYSISVMKFGQIDGVRRRNSINAIVIDNDTISDFIASICDIRHLFHCVPINDFYSHERFPHKIVDEINRLNEEINAMQLNQFGFIVEFDIDKCPNVIDEELDCVDSNSIDEYRSRSFSVIGEMKEKTNQSIEIFLRNIDKKFGSEYAPKGTFRKLV